MLSHSSITVKMRDGKTLGKYIYQGKVKRERRKKRHKAEAYSSIL